jgi:acyl dehydratase
VPVSSSSLDQSGEPATTDVDARWLMAYAAGLGDEDACYHDTTRGIVAHPLFPVCFEWPVFLSTHGLPGAESLTAEERLRGVHATHDLVLHRPIRPGDQLATTATVVGVERRPPGAYQVVRLDTRDADDAPVCTTWYGSLYRGVEIEGAGRPAPDLPPRPDPALAPRADPAQGECSEVVIPIAATAAHVYTECARIWNPIHTDAAVAVRAGLPGIILHGTATLALAVSRVVERAGDPARVRRISGRFGAMVPMPSKITVSISEPVERNGSDAVHFEVRNAEGATAIRDGLVTF